MTRRLALLLVLVASVAAVVVRAQVPRVYDLPLRPETVHWGYYDSKIPPALRVASGDRVRVETMIAGGLQRLRLAGVADAEIPESLKTVEQRVTERGPGGHPMSGPIFVEGAQPGDTLEIRILAIDYLHHFGVNAFNPGGGVLPELVLADRIQDRYRGLLLGLALGDALGAPAQHRRPGSFAPVGDLTGGGPYELPRGAWSDDTALPLLLADSLLAHNGYDPRDFVQRCQRWQREGYLSSTGQCLGITATTARALAQAQWSGNPFAGSHDPARAEKEPLLRAGVAVAFALADPEAAIALAAEVARPTHQAPVALDACRYYAALLIGALQGEPLVRLLAPNYTPVPGLWERRPLKPEVAAVAAGGWRSESRPAGAQPGYGGGGTAIDGLAVVLRALARGTGYRDTVLTAVNLGEDADTNGALTGQLAGALYGARGLPPHWLVGLVAADLVTRSADRLLEAALRKIAGG